jgi:hypothetical protein
MGMIHAQVILNIHTVVAYHAGVGTTYHYSRSQARFDTWLVKLLMPVSPSPGGQFPGVMCISVVLFRESQARRGLLESWLNPRDKYNAGNWYALEVTGICAAH